MITGEVESIPSDDRSLLKIDVGAWDESTGRARVEEQRFPILMYTRVVMSKPTRKNNMQWSDLNFLDESDESSPR